MPSLTAGLRWFVHQGPCKASAYTIRSFDCSRDQQDDMVSPETTRWMHARFRAWFTLPCPATCVRLGSRCLRQRFWPVSASAISQPQPSHSLNPPGCHPSARTCSLSQPPQPDPSASPVAGQDGCPSFPAFTPQTAPAVAAAAWPAPPRAACRKQTRCRPRCRPSVAGCTSGLQRPPAAQRWPAPGSPPGPH